MALEVTRDSGDQQQFDALAVRDKDPAFHYRWARKTDMAVASHQFRGYEVVDTETDKARSVLSQASKMKKKEDVDSTITLGDLVLIRMPIEKYQQRLRDEAALCKRREAAVKGAFKQAVKDTVPAEHQPEDRSISFEEQGEGRGYHGPGATDSDVMKAIEEERTRSGT